jgi:hypothetical protein
VKVLLTRTSSRYGQPHPDAVLAPGSSDDAEAQYDAVWLYECERIEDCLALHDSIVVDRVTMRDYYERIGADLTGVEYEVELYDDYRE